MYNGMGLIGLAASYQFMVTALVLLAVATGSDRVTGSAQLTCSSPR